MDDIYNSYHKIEDRELYASRNTSSAIFRGNWLQTLRFDYIPVIKREDIDKGYIIRYFTRRANLVAGEITEISVQDKWKLQKIGMFRFVDIPWKISGMLEDIAGEGSVHSPIRKYTGVLTANKENVMLAESNMPGIKLKLTDYRQYYQG